MPGDAMVYVSPGERIVSVCCGNSEFGSLVIEPLCGLSYNVTTPVDPSDVTFVSHDRRTT